MVYANHPLQLKDLTKNLGSRHTVALLNDPEYPVTNTPRDLDALGSGEVMVVSKLGIVVTVAVVVSE